MRPVVSLVPLGIRPLHSSVPALSRLPPLEVRVTKRARIRHARKQKFLHERLGSKYRLLKKLPDLHQKPVPPPPCKIEPVLASDRNREPPKIVIRDVLKNLERDDLVAEAEKPKEQVNNELRSGVRKMQQEIDTKHVERRTIEQLAIRDSDIPIITPDSDTTLNVQTQGPYFAYNVSAKEAITILKQAPETIKSMIANNELKEGTSLTGEEWLEQAEMVRRIISLNSASAHQMFKFNKQRLQAIFGEHERDSGSSAVQAALFTLRINQMTEHLKTHRKDMGTKRALQGWVSKRIKILKYLRRKDIKKFVITCHAIGVNPEEIQVKV